MRYNTLWAVLLLCTVLPQSLGWTIPRRALYEDGVDVSSLAKKGRDTFIFTASGHLEARRHLTKRVDIELPEGVGGEIGAGEGTTSDLPTTESEGNAENTGEASNSESDGEGSESSSVSGSEPDPGIIMLPPGGVAPALIPRSVVARVPTEDVFQLRTALKTLQPNIEFTSSFEAYDWLPFAYGGPSWKGNSIFSIKFGEALANHAGPVHVLYHASTDDNLPAQSLLTLAEMPLITAPGSKVTQIYRWDLDTYQQAISGSGGPQYNVIWTAGDGQMGTEISDLTNDPKATDENTPVINATGDDPNSDTGCTCGLPNCLCQ